MTTALMAANLVVFIWEWRLPLLQKMGVLHRYALSLDGLEHGLWWQFLSYQFLHGNWLHLLFNLLFLHSIGPVLELTIGAWRYVALYLISGVLGGALHVLVAWMSPATFSAPVVGASAGLCGLLAAVCALFAEETVDVKLFYLIPLRMRAKFLLLGVAVVTMGGALLPFGQVAHLAHLGGLVGGLVCLNFMNVRPLPGPDEQTRR